jgi:hypothetical protein
MAAIQASLYDVFNPSEEPNDTQIENPPEAGLVKTKTAGVEM